VVEREEAVTVTEAVATEVAETGTEVVAMGRVGVEMEGAEKGKVEEVMEPGDLDRRQVLAHGPSAPIMPTLDPSAHCEQCGYLILGVLRFEPPRKR
jgi:hypothetical protein